MVAAGVTLAGFDLVGVSVLLTTAEAVRVDVDAPVPPGEKATVHRGSVVYTISAWLAAASTPPMDRQAVPGVITACVSAYAPLKHRM